MPLFPHTSGLIPLTKSRSRAGPSHAKRGSLIKRAGWLALAGCLAAHPAAAQQYTPEQQYTPVQTALARFDAKIAAEVRDDGIGAISAGVILGDSLVWTRAWGWSDVARQLPARGDEVYRIASVTKLFTAVLMMRLVESGVIELDESVEPYVPELQEHPDRREGTRPITFRHLASHASGLAGMPDVAEPYLPVDDWEARLLEILPETPILGAPGDTARYSSVGTAVLGLALQRAADRTFFDLMAEEVIEPLGMTHTGYRVSDAMRERLAMGYYHSAPDGRSDPETFLRYQERFWFGVPSSMLYSTVPDLARLVAMLMGAPGESEQFLSPSSISEMRRLQSVRERFRGSGYEPGYGLVLGIFEHNSGAVFFSKDGAGAGYSAWISFDPEQEIGVILLRNYNAGDRKNLALPAIELMLDLVQANSPGN